MLLQIPANTHTYELLNSIIWFDNDGILYSMPKKAVYIEQTRENISSEIVRFKEIVGDRKVKLVVEAHPNARPIGRKDRDFIAEQYASVLEALAIINSSSISKMITNIFFLFNPPTYPTKMFTTVAEAREWILDPHNKSKSGKLKVLA